MFKRLIQRLTNWEHWPFYIFYFPISFKWFWYYIKSRSLWFFTSSNPTLEFGGFEGEGKTKMAQLLPSHLYPKSILVNPSISFASVMKLVREQYIPYPFIVKPDIGMKGILFRIVENESQLEKYHRAIPVNYIIQEYVILPYEVSVFYYRKPDEDKGCITALIKKNLPSVTGDGKKTLLELVAENPNFKIGEMQINKQFGERVMNVLHTGEKFYLSHIANLHNGTKFINLNYEIDDKILRVFDNISHANNFFYGRYDIKCSSIDDLREGENFKILEFNGSGSVPNHIYAGGFNLINAYKEILKHWKALFDISEYNNKSGIRYWSFLKGWRFLQKSKKHFDVLKQLDKELFLN